MAVPELLNLRGYAGDPLHVDLTVQDTNGVPVSIVGAAIAAQVRKTTRSDVLTEFDVVPVAPLEGRVRLTLTGAKTALIDRGGVWDVQIIPAGETDPTTLRHGSIHMTTDVTR